MPSYSTSKARWVAVTTRDPSASNAFIYCVTTTKIYCRPNCPARLARRAHVVFHDTAADAQAAGYRACMRCRPGSVDESEGNPQRIAIKKACELVNKEGSDKERWSVKNLAKEVRLTESHFCRVFKKIMGLTVGEYRSSVSGEKVEEPKELAPSKPKPTVWDNGRSSASLQFQCVPNFVHTHDDSVLDFDSDFARDWYNFSGVPIIFDTAYVFPGIDDGQVQFNSSPEIISDISTPTTMDDGFQFLDFDAVGNHDRDEKIMHAGLP